MIKNVIVTFEFDTETESVSNVECSVDGVEKKKKTTRKKSEVIEEMASQSIITLEANKLSFNNKAVADMAIEYEDRIVIKWIPIKKGSKILIPIIGKDISFNEEGGGSKITKTNSIVYKGKQNVILAELGEQFTIEPHEEGIWKLVSLTGGKTPETLKDIIEIVEKENPMLIIEQGDNVEIDEFQFTLKS